MDGIVIYDTTLRDGAQAEDIAFTTEDKLRIAERLDDFGVHYIEGGWPGSNPRDGEFFECARSRLHLRRAKLVAFGATRHAGVSASNDSNIAALVKSGTSVVTIFGKTWIKHVLDDLRIDAQENLELIYDSIQYLKQYVGEVIFDAEHFFDGFLAHRDYAISCLKAAEAAGADVLCLCDTNGGRLPWEIADIVAVVDDLVARPIGIHCHNDSDNAVANTLVAVRAGATQVQGTINGIGERCGNVNLISVIADLQLTMGYQVTTQLNGLRDLSRFVYEIANLEPSKRQPYVGESAFAHKGGVHVAAVEKDPGLYEHIDPSLVGNNRRILISDLSGRSNILRRAADFGIDLRNDDPRVKQILAELKNLEHRGFQFEGAEASFELLLRRRLGEVVHHFRLLHYRLIDEKHGEGKKSEAEATVMLKLPNDAIEHQVATGKGPVHALDSALRKALEKHYPGVANMRLHDYKVRVLGDGKRGTESTVRVLIESGDDQARWGTVGVSDNVIDASWLALVDAVDYKLYKHSNGLSE